MHCKGCVKGIGNPHFKRGAEMRILIYHGTDKSQSEPFTIPDYQYGTMLARCKADKYSMDVMQEDGSWKTTVIDGWEQ